MADFAPNTLYYGDNLHVLRDFPDECVDLVYLDPPFNSARSYNVLFKEAKGTESEDTDRRVLPFHGSAQVADVVRASTPPRRTTR